MAAKVSWKITKTSSGSSNAGREGGGGRVGGDAGQEELGEIADKGRKAPFGRAGKGQRIAIDHPEQGDHGRSRRTPASAPTACSWRAPGRHRTAPGPEWSSAMTRMVETSIQAVSPLSTTATTSAAAAAQLRRRARRPGRRPAAPAQGGQRTLPSIFDVLRPVIVVSPKGMTLRGRPRRFHRCGCG